MRSEIGPESIRQNVVPPAPEFTPVGMPVTISRKEPSTYDELRLVRTQKQGEAAPRVDIRTWTVHTSGGADTPHKGGLSLTPAEAAALRDALNTIDL